MKNDKFLEGFIEALIWSSSDMDTEEPIDCSWDDFNEGLKARLKIECQEFKRIAMGVYPEYLEYWNESQAGHDFALTRNRHGAGFWDRHLDFDNNREVIKVIGKKLTTLSHNFGELTIYFGDDGKVYA